MTTSKTVTYNFNKDNNGREAILFTSKEDNQTITLFSYSSCAEFSLPPRTLTPHKLRELADLLENNENL